MHAILLPEFDLNRDLTPDVSSALNKRGNVVSNRRLSAGAHGLKVINMNNSKSCNQLHLKQLDESMLTSLATHQINVKEAHKCCQCAYNSGYQQGSLLQKFISLDVESLGDSHVGTEGHAKSIHQAFALGYNDGVNSFIEN